MTEIRRVGVPTIFRYSIGQVLDYESAARASVVVDINYETGAMALEPYATRPVGVLRRILRRLRERAWT